MQFCTQCGHENTAGARFCSNCGAPLRQGGESQTSTISLRAIDSLIEAESADTGAGLSASDQAAVDALPPGCALLVVQRGPSSGSRFLLDSDLTSAGRHPESDIFLDDVTVSRRHAEFVRDGARFKVRDVGSLNGTYVNRERIDEIVLAGGDEVQIGKFRLVFFASQAPDSAGGTGADQAGGSTGSTAS
ncbi:MAG: FHA domain-containing protein [Actinomycetales bacterium]